MNINVYRDTDDAVFLVFAEGDAGILRFDPDGGWGEVPEVPASAVLQTDDRSHEIARLAEGWEKAASEVTDAPTGTGYLRGRRDGWSNGAKDIRGLLT